MSAPALIYALVFTAVLFGAFGLIATLLRPRVGSDSFEEDIAATARANISARRLAPEAAFGGADD